MQKRAIAIHDISCVGRCSLTVALPVLSAAGVNTAIVPTALLSTHTGEFTGYTHLDLSDQLAPIAKHLSTLGLHYDAFYTGYLASGAQVSTVLTMLDLLSDERTHVFVDPAFADHGRIYKLLGADMPQRMRGLCARAQTIVPNLTEAALLLGEPCGDEPPTHRRVGELCRRLCELGPQNVVITDVSFSPRETGAAIYRRGMAEPVFSMRERFEGVFHGTGDVFASFLLAALMNDRPLEDAAELALDLTHQSICLTLASGQPLRYGVQFEQALPLLWERLRG